MHLCTSNKLQAPVQMQKKKKYCIHNVNARKVYPCLPISSTNKWNSNQFHGVSYFSTADSARSDTSVAPQSDFSTSIWWCIWFVTQHTVCDGNLLPPSRITAKCCCATGLQKRLRVNGKINQIHTPFFILEWTISTKMWQSDAENIN